MATQKNGTAEQFRRLNAIHRKVLSLRFHASTVLEEVVAAAFPVDIIDRAVELQRGLAWLEREISMLVPEDDEGTRLPF